MPTPRRWLLVRALGFGLCLALLPGVALADPCVNNTPDDVAKLQQGKLWEFVVGLDSDRGDCPWGGRIGAILGPVAAGGIGGLIGIATAWGLNPWAPARPALASGGRSPLTPRPPPPSPAGGGPGGGPGLSDRLRTLIGATGSPPAGPSTGGGPAPPGPVAQPSADSQPVSGRLEPQQGYGGAPSFDAEGLFDPTSPVHSLDDVPAPGHSKPETDDLPQVPDDPLDLDPAFRAAGTGGAPRVPTAPTIPASGGLAEWIKQNKGSVKVEIDGKEYETLPVPKPGPSGSPDLPGNIGAAAYDTVTVDGVEFVDPTKPVGIIRSGSEAGEPLDSVERPAADATTPPPAESSPAPPHADSRPATTETTPVPPPPRTPKSPDEFGSSLALPGTTIVDPKAGGCIEPDGTIGLPPGAPPDASFLNGTRITMSGGQVTIRTDLGAVRINPSVAANGQVTADIDADLGVSAGALILSGGTSLEDQVKSVITRVN